MNSSKILLLFTSLTFSVSSFGADYWFTRGQESTTADRNWSSLANWSTKAVSSDGWNISPASSFVGSASTNYDTVTLGTNSGYNGTDASLHPIILDTNASISKLTIGGVNVPNAITSSNSSKLTFLLPTQTTADSNLSPTIINKTSAEDFTFNTNIDIHTAIGTSGTTTTGLWSRIYNHSGALTFADGYTLSYLKNNGYSSDMRFYVGTSSSSTNRTSINVNSKIVSDYQIVFGSAGGSGSYSGVFTIGGSQSNQTTGNMIVENGVYLEFRKTNGAYAHQGFRLQLLNSTVRYFASNQLLATTQLAFSQSSTASNAVKARLELNGFSQQVKNIRFEAASWLSKGVSCSSILDFGSNDIAQTFIFGGFEFGTIVAKENAGTSKGLILEDTFLIIENFDIGQDKLISSVELSSKALSTTIPALQGKTWLDLLVFNGYNMDDFIITETFNGTNWEYSLAAIPEPATCGALLAILGLSVVFMRRKN